MSIRPSAWNNSPPTGEIFMKFDMWLFLQILSRKLRLHYNLPRITDTLHEDLCTFVTSGWIIFRMRYVCDKSCRKNRNAHLKFNNSLPKAVPFMRQRVKIVVETDRPQITIWRLRFACWIPKATNTHSHYVILLFHCNNRCKNAPQLYVCTYIVGLVSC